MIKVSSIKNNPNNPRTIDEDKLEKLKRSIESFPEMMEKRQMVCVTDVDGKLYPLGGNMRLKAIKDLGMKEIPKSWVSMADEWTEEQRREFIIKDNASLGSWDLEDLQENWDLDLISEWGVDLDIDEVEELEAEEDDFDVELPEEPKTVLGDLYEIGEHRLLCGDSTDSDSVAKLMNGEKAIMSFTSPPYNAGKSESLSGNTHTTDNKYNEYNDNQTQSDYLDLLIGFTNNALLFSEYLICNIQSLAGNKIALIEYLNQYKNNFIDVAIWDKGHGQPAMAENVMTSVWEYLFFISSKENATRAIPNGNFRGTVPNIYRGKPQRKNEFSNVHAATFPIDLPEWAIQFTKQNDIVLDQFLGSGTTMVAAHQLNRKCYGMELDPKYCDVIINRMIKLDPDLKIKRNGIDITNEYIVQ